MIEKHEEQIAGLIGSLNDYGDLFHGVTQNIATCAEITVNKINGLLSARKYGTDRVQQFMKKRLPYREVSFYDPIQRITIETSFTKKKQREVISVIKEDHQVL